MDLKQLEYFVRVAELGSFTRAAVELDVAQPALSRQVRLLEVELRQTLLVRNGRGAVPTEAGQVLLEHGRGILHQVQRARDDLGRLRGGLSGRVALGLPSSVARVLAVPLTRAFREAMPDAKLSISEALSSGLQEGLASGRLDIAVLYNAQPSRELDVIPLVEEDLLLVRARPPGLHEDPPPGPVELAEVAKLPLVIPSRPNAIRMHVESALARIGARPNVALEIDGVTAILDLVL
ncbi:MAG TPA: LysR substrate-binding domain-containing protein, partial [Ramlibacter sp.]